MPRDPDILQIIRADERFEERLRREAAMPPEMKRSRLAALEARAILHPGTARIRPGDRFDTLEYPDDVPITPPGGNMLPSERWRGRGASMDNGLFEANSKEAEWLEDLCGG